MTWATEMNLFTSTPVVLFEVDFPGGTEYFSFTSVRFPTRHYKGRIIRISPLRRSMQQFLGFIETASIDVTLEDTDSSIIAKYESDQIKGVETRLKLGTQALDLADFQIVYQGVIDDFSSDNFTTRFIIKDRLWTMPPHLNTGYVNEDDFPNALPADSGKPLPLCYGTHSETFATDPNDYRNAGAWPTLFVDVQSGNRYFLIARHAVKQVNEVYAFVESKGSQLLTLTTDYTVSKAGTLAGETMAYISLTASGWGKVTDTNGRLGVITCNVLGREDNDDGTGTLITNPITILLDILENYADNPDIDTTSFAAMETVCDDNAYVARGGYTEEKSTDTFLKEFLDSFGVRLYMTKSGEVGANIYQPISPFVVNLKIREQWEILKGTFGVEFTSDIQGAEDSQVVNSCDYQYDHHWAKGHFRATGQETDSASITTYGEKKLTIYMPWADDQNTAIRSAQQIVQLYVQPVARMRCTSAMMGMNIELADPVTVTHEHGPGGGFDGRAFELIEHTWDPNNNTVELAAKDVGALVGTSFFLDDDTLRILANTGTAGVVDTDGTITITSGPASLVDAGVQIGDIIRLKTVTNEGNRSCHKITGVTATTVEVANTSWTTESSIVYDIIPSWITAEGNQTFSGHLCDESSGQFSNGDPGKELK